MKILKCKPISCWALLGIINNESCICLYSIYVEYRHCWALL